MQNELVNDFHVFGANDSQAADVIVPVDPLAGASMGSLS
jgi:hypothetical protein